MKLYIYFPTLLGLYSCLLKNPCSCQPVTNLCLNHDDGFQSLTDENYVVEYLLNEILKEPYGFSKAPLALDLLGGEYYRKGSDKKNNSGKNRLKQMQIHHYPEKPYEIDDSDHAPNNQHSYPRAAELEELLHELKKSFGLFMGKPLDIKYTHSKLNKKTEPIQSKTEIFKENEVTDDENTENSIDNATYRKDENISLKDLHTFNPITPKYKKKNSFPWRSIDNVMELDNKKHEFKNDETINKKFKVNKQAFLNRTPLHEKTQDSTLSVDDIYRLLNGVVVNMRRKEELATSNENVDTNCDAIENNRKRIALQILNEYFKLISAND